MAVIPVSRNLNAPASITDRGLPVASPTNRHSPSPSRARAENKQGRSPPLPDIPRLSPRNAPIPNRHHVIDIFPLAPAEGSRSGASAQAHNGLTDHGGSLPLPLTHAPTSRSVAFHQKLAATLKTGIAIAAPIAAVNAVADGAGHAILGTVHHMSNSVGSDMRTSLVAAGLGVVADAAVTTLVAAAGHKYLDEKFYHEKNKTADEMIAAKKANSAAFAYIGGAGSSVAMSLAATALTGGSVTASVVKSTLISQAIGGLIVHPVVLGVATSALAYQFRNRTDRAPDSLQAGFEEYAAWLSGKLAMVGSATEPTAPETHAGNMPVIAPGDDMV